MLECCCDNGRLYRGRKKHAVYKVVNSVKQQAWNQKTVTWRCGSGSIVKNNIQPISKFAGAKRYSIEAGYGSV